MKQMELGLEAAQRCRSRDRKRRRQSRAGWWFERMRQVVDGATESAASPSGAAGQSWFAETRDPAGAKN